MTDKPPVIPIQPDVVYMPPDDYELPVPKLVIEKATDYKFCGHEQVKIYPRHRQLYCVRCGCLLDPFDHLLMVAQQEGNQLSHLRYLKVQVKQLTEQEEQLRKEVNKLKRQLKNTK